MKKDCQMWRQVRSTSFTTKEEDNKGGVDRISILPDKLLHHILSFSDAQLAVQTSILSKRWKLIWTTLPFLNFTSSCKRSDFASQVMFIHNFFSLRNHASDVLKLDLSFNFAPEFPTPLVDKFINYAISHNVRDLNVNIPGFDYIDDIQLSRPNYLTSTTINKLVLKLNFRVFWRESDSCWQLPALATLHLIRPNYWKSYKLPESYLVCLPSLRTLLLDGFELPSSISLPALQTLILHTVEFPENMSEFCQIFQNLANLQNLTLFFWTTLRTDCVIDCPQLVNLEINYYTSKSGKSIVTTNSSKIMVLAPKIRNFSSVGIFPIKFGVYGLENVSIQLPDGAETVATYKTKEIFYHGVRDMFRGLGGAKILTLDLKTIEALSAISFILVSSSSPFYDLEHVKVPHGFKISSMSTYLKWYLLGSSPQATIVTTLPQKSTIPRTEATSAAAQNVVLQEPVAAPTKALVGSEKLHKTVCIDTLSMVVKEEHVVQNSVVNADRFTQIGVPVEGTGNDLKSTIPRTEATSATAQNVVLQEPLAAPTKALVGSEKLHKTVCIDTLSMVVKEEHVVQNYVVNADRFTQIGVPAEGTGNDLVSSSSGYSGFGLWHDHEVNSEFVCVLDLIMTKYPETFEPFTTKNRKVCTMKLNTLCTSVKDFSKISMTDVDTEMIAMYRDVFSGLQKFGFNVSWLVRRLNYIEQLRFSQPLLPELHVIDCHIDDAISKLQDLETKLQDLRSLRAEKMEEIHKAFGTMGAKLAIGCIGNDLFSGP